MAPSASRNTACLLLSILALNAIASSAGRSPSMMEMAEGEGGPSLNEDLPCDRQRPETDPECLRVCGDDMGNGERRFPSKSNEFIVAKQGLADEDHDYEVASSCCCCPKGAVCISQTWWAP